MKNTFKNNAEDFPVTIIAPIEPGDYIVSWTSGPVSLKITTYDHKTETNKTTVNDKLQTSPLKFTSDGTNKLVKIVFSGEGSDRKSVV